LAERGSRSVRVAIARIGLAEAELDEAVCAIQEGCASQAFYRRLDGSVPEVNHP
jgi:hypothetical protein